MYLNLYRSAPIASTVANPHPKVHEMAKGAEE